MSKRATWWTIVGVVIIILLGWWYISSKNDHANTKPTSTNQSTTPTPTAMVSTTPTPTVASHTGIGSGSASNIAYNDALKIYGPQGNNDRFQFTSCHGVPGNLSLRSGVKFMLDNRDDTAHTIKIGTISYKLPAYGFDIISFSPVGSYNITCDGNAASMLNVEK